MKNKNSQIEASPEYQKALQAALDGGMNSGESHEFALDQASRPAVVSIPVADPLKESRAIIQHNHKSGNIWVEDAAGTVLIDWYFASEFDAARWCANRGYSSSVKNIPVEAPLAVPAVVSIPVADPLKEARAIMVNALCASPKHSESCEGQKFAGHHRNFPANHLVWKVAPKCSCWVGQMAAWLEANH